MVDAQYQNYYTDSKLLRNVFCIYSYICFFSLCFSVLYFSWHRFEHMSFWPNLAESDYDSVGKGKGAGFNINLPWNKVPIGAQSTYII